MPLSTDLGKAFQGVVALENEYLNFRPMDKKYDFGLIGLGVMGQNFILNVADNGYSVIGIDLDDQKVASLINAGGDIRKVNATNNTETFMEALTVPRRIMMLVPAGKAVDAVINSLLPYIEKGDVLIDGGNSYYSDTDRRGVDLGQKGIFYFGAGVSGGAEGARKGPSIMPGGPREAYAHIKPIFEAVAAKYGKEACVAYMGPRSAGNYVKMVHNGIEYGLMQAISETYGVLKHVGDFDNNRLSEIFEQWNRGRLKSFLVEITAMIFQRRDPLERGDLIDHILDKAKQKGTGKWTSQDAMNLGIPVPTIDMSVTMREISSYKVQRQRAEALYGRKPVDAMEPDELVRLTENALYFTFILTFAQGLHQLSEASVEYGYELDLAIIAKIWRAGCIIRAGLLADIAEVYSHGKQPGHLLLSHHFAHEVKDSLEATRRLAVFGIKNALPLPALNASLVYFDAFTTGRLPTNLIQAQRDFFGSHTYERTDREGIFHTDWDA